MVFNPLLLGRSMRRGNQQDFAEDGCDDDEKCKQRADFMKNGEQEPKAEQMEVDYETEEENGKGEEEGSEQVSAIDGADTGIEIKEKEVEEEPEEGENKSRDTAPDEEETDSVYEEDADTENQGYDDESEEKEEGISQEGISFEGREENKGTKKIIPQAINTTSKEPSAQPDITPLNSNQTHQISPAVSQRELRLPVPVNHKETAEPITYINTISNDAHPASVISTKKVVSPVLTQREIIHSVNPPAKVVPVENNSPIVPVAKSAPALPQINNAIPVKGVIPTKKIVPPAITQRELIHHVKPHVPVVPVAIPKAVVLPVNTPIVTNMNPPIAVIPPIVHPNPPHMHFGQSFGGYHADGGVIGPGNWQGKNWFSIGTLREDGVRYNGACCGNTCRNGGHFGCCGKCPNCLDCPY